MPDVTISIESFDCPWLDQLGALLDNPKEILVGVGKTAGEAVVDHIKDDTHAPLATSTLRQKALHGGSTKPLIGHGGLIDSMLMGGHDSTTAVQGDTVIVGTSHPGALYLDEGTRRMPARPYLFLDDDDLETIVDEVLTALTL